MGEVFGALLGALGWLIAFLYDLIPNYGVAIILFTTIANFALMPLTLKQTRSMRAMADLGPEVKELQRKYKNDRAQLQQETMKLYQERGVNPLSGCLPILAQTPIFIAVYTVVRNPIGNPAADPENVGHLPMGSALREALESGTAGFLGLDLEQSASNVLKDNFVSAIPYLVLILIVMATSYVSQIQLAKMRAKGGQGVPDTPQARQMQTLARIFPFLFGFISYSLPAGLVLYFATGNVVRWGIQTIVIRSDQDRGGGEAGGTPARTPEPEPDPEPQPKRPQSGSKKGYQKKKRG